MKKVVLILVLVFGLVSGMFAAPTLSATRSEQNEIFNVWVLDDGLTALTFKGKFNAQEKEQILASLLEYTELVSFEIITPTKDILRLVNKTGYVIIFFEGGYFKLFTDGPKEGEVVSILVGPKA